MKRLSKEFQPDAAKVIYRRGKVLYDGRPDSCKVRYYLFDQEENYYIAVCRREYHIFEVLLSVLCVILFLLNRSKVNLDCYIQVQDVLYAKDGVIEMNVMNLNQSDLAVEIYLEKSSVPITYINEISKGQELHDAELLQEMDKGSYVCSVVCTVIVDKRKVVERSNILLVIE